LQQSQEHGQQSSFDLGSMDVGLHSHLATGMEVGLGYESALNMGAMGDFNLMFHPQGHSEYVTGEIHQPQPYQPQTQLQDGHFASAPHDTSAFLQSAHTDIGPSAVPADMPHPTPPLGDNPPSSTEFPSGP
jgi:hypothetical protein